MPPPNSALAKAADLGLKLTVAAEILCARHGGGGGGGGGAAAAAAAAAGGGGGGGGSVATREATLAADPGWRAFRASLESSGYLRGNIPGSIGYKELMAAAVEAYTAGMAAPSVDPAAGGAVGAAPAGRRLAELVRRATAGELLPVVAVHFTSALAHSNGPMSSLPSRSPEPLLSIGRAEALPASMLRRAMRNGHDPRCWAACQPSQPPHIERRT
ncbi:hypothetical protein TSOC_001219 [Tetrabaena socialis]|uniref:Uncharacterized protein n=1 Tax=Tetrabaena socialis TaxID=47790 RepID=A0A2J8AHB0_9CHLO|nr:hypothetical protein TSOC_001219 [Tetrabaena socialis]|eukprot:PNH11886.1 hypothetical protein TSOC_001219 [Tetrabaena socialis]